MEKNKLAIQASVIALVAAVLGGTGCTQQTKGSFRLAQQEEVFASTQDVNTKLDMLWVIDNSGSMNVSQQRIRDGFTTFALKYMKPTWDIRVAVITTDTFIAHSAFQGWNNAYAVNPGSSFRSSYVRGITANGIPGRTTPFVNPTWAPTLIDVNPASSNYGKFTAGLKNNQMHPQYNSNWAKLIPGNHDGAVTSLCTEQNSAFIDPSNVSKCYIRDDQTRNTGIANCVTPSGGETSSSQCINTTMNDTVHSGSPIISTIPPEGVPADAAWTDALIGKFLVNLNPGINGLGTERALGSMMQLIADNEAAGSTTKFFREGSLRAIILVGDEDDQTMVIPGSIPSNYSPGSNYIGACNHVIDGVTFSVPNCPDPAKLVPVATIKTQLDNFFLSLDAANPDATPNYFVTSIVPSTAASVQAIRTERGTGEVDRPDRFIELGNLVGNGSVVMDLNSADYTPMLDAIGRAVVEKKAVFTLKRAPTGEEDMIVTVKHIDGTQQRLRADQFTVSGKTLTITDMDFMLTLASTDQIVINYQPRTVY